MNATLTLRSVAALAALSASALSLGQYTATVLNPSGSTLSIAMAAQGGHQAGYVAGSIPGNAVLWSGTSGSAVDLHPVNFTLTRAYGISGNSQVGEGAGLATGGPLHALIWTGTAGSYIDLQPAGFQTSYAYGVDGGTQVGGGMTNAGDVHAIMWTGTAASAADLNPPGFASSMAYAVSGQRQLGYGSIGGSTHAVLWAATPDSAVDVNPAGMTSSTGNGLDATSLVGVASGPATGGIDHAILWDSALNVTDLNPASLSSSSAQGVAGGYQAGYGIGALTNNKYHALVWNGTANSVVDLHQFLGSGYTSSYAYGIDPVTLQIVGEAVTTTGRHVAMLWTPTATEQTVNPDTFTVTRGNVTSGGLSDLLTSDDHYLAVKAGVIPFLTDYPVSINITGTSPVQTPSTLKIQLEAHCQLSIINQTIELYDYTTSSYVQVDLRAATTTDSTVLITASNPARFVQTGTRLVSARLRWRAATPPPLLAWLVSVDQAVWKITP